MCSGEPHYAMQNSTFTTICGTSGIKQKVTCVTRHVCGSSGYDKQYLQDALKLLVDWPEDQLDLFTPSRALA